MKSQQRHITTFSLPFLPLPPPDRDIVLKNSFARNAVVDADFPVHASVEKSKCEHGGDASQAVSAHNFIPIEMTSSFSFKFARTSLVNKVRIDLFKVTLRFQPFEDLFLFLSHTRHSCSEHCQHYGNQLRTKTAKECRLRSFEH